MAGRKLKLTAEVSDKIVNAIRAGNFAEQSAISAGISKTSFWRYMSEGEAIDAALRDPESEMGEDKLTDTQRKMWEFWTAVTRARSEAETTAVQHLRDAMPDDWRAVAFYLERAFPKRWAKRIQPPLTDDVPADQNGYTIAQLMEYVDGDGHVA